MSEEEKPAFGELDGKHIKITDVPKDRLADVIVEIKGKRVRPWRFVGPAAEAKTSKGKTTL